MTSKLKTDVLETVSGSGTIALTNQLSGMTSASVPSGSVLQVLIVEDSSGMSTSSTSYVDTNLSLTITPSSTSSKILSMWNTQARHSAGNTGHGCQLIRGSTAIFSVPIYSNYSAQSGDRRWTSHQHLDSPNTTSATTYKVQVGAHNGGMEFNENGTKTQLTLIEIKG